MADKMAGRRARPRKAAGPPRPTFLRGEDTDRVMAILLALMSEVAALRDRVDTHERLALVDALPTPAAVEGYRPDEAVDQERESRRDAMLKRLLRVVLEELEPVASS